MMSSFYLILKKIKVENACATSGLICGFPSLTQIGGFVHSLQRDLRQSFIIKGFIVVAHEHQLHVHNMNLKLQRFPLNHKGVPAPIIQEGRINLTVSLVLECEGKLDQRYRESLKNSIFKKRFASGLITKIEGISYVTADNDFNYKKIIKKELHNGFFLQSLRKEFIKHLESSDKSNELEEFMSCISNNRTEKPIPGWVVPIHVGYKGISKLFDPGIVLYSRDPSTPFRFVENIYSLAKWSTINYLSKSKEFKKGFWRTKFKENFYYFDN